MSRPADRTTPPESGAEFGAEYWESRYGSGEPTSRHDPSPSLAADVGALAPGTALDAGCGRGADAIWLASHGWQLTAVDISATALEHAQQDARAAGGDVARRIEWIRADLTEWEPGARRFDLVTSHYVHVPGPAETLFSRLASWVAVGGTLLVVGHDGTRTGTGPRGHSSEHHGHQDEPGTRPGAHPEHGHAHPPGATIRIEDVTADLSADQWDIVVAERRSHPVRRPGGAGAVTLHDVVVRARRRGPARP